MSTRRATFSRRSPALRSGHPALPSRCPARPARRPAPRASGFSLVEVMVALVVIAVGLLGIGKMQALALASTTSASMRSLAAIEAASLAAAMHTNRDYWDASPPQTITISGTSITSNPSGFPTAGADCTATGMVPCDVTTLASYDLEQWVLAINQLLPNVSATISCENSTPPVSCTIQITWVENAVAVNSQEASTTTANAESGTTAAFQNPTYTLYVEP